MTAGAGPSVATCLPVGSDADLTWVRKRIRQTAARLGFGLVQLTKLVTAASELARNTLVHGGGGHVEITPVERGGARGLRLSFVDGGPGIRDVELAMTDGYTSGDGLGLGLSGARRLVHEFELDTEPGRGTTVTVVAWTADVPAARSGGAMTGARDIPVHDPVLVRDVRPATGGAGTPARLDAHRTAVAAPAAVPAQPPAGPAS